MICLKNENLIFRIQAEGIIESLDIWQGEKLKYAEYEATQKALGKEAISQIQKANLNFKKSFLQVPRPVPHLILQALGPTYTPERFVLESLRKVPAR